MVADPIITKQWKYVEFIEQIEFISDLATHMRWRPVLMLYNWNANTDTSVHVSIEETRFPCKKKLLIVNNKEKNLLINKWTKIWIK